MSNFRVEYVGKSPSVNHIYSEFVANLKAVLASKGKVRPKIIRFMNQKGKDFRKEFDPLIKEAEPPSKADWYILRVTFTLPLRFKNGNVRRWDASDYVKIVEDAIADVLEIDDRHNRSVIVEKHEGEWGFIAELIPINEEAEQIEV